MQKSQDPSAEALAISKPASYTVSSISFAISELATADPAVEANACADRGAALAAQGKFAEAIPQFQRAIALASRSESLPQFWRELGASLGMDGQASAALRAFDAALSLSPSDERSRVYRALVLLKSGDFQEGWAQYEWRRKLSEWQGFRLSHIPEWRGEELRARKIVLLTEQGLGDCVQFIRYAPVLSRCGAHVFVGCAYNPELRRLFASIDGVSGVYGAEDRNIRADYQCYLMSLPLRMGTTLETIPGHFPYIKADAVTVAQWAQRLGPRRGLRVGLVWAGRRRPEPRSLQIDLRRSLSLAALAPLFEVADLEWFSLQKDASANGDNMSTLPIADFPSNVNDFLDVAPLVANLDLVISVDTAIAHLAGAMGKPVWMLSRYDACWCWMFDRCDTPWYPTMRLFRQPGPADWNSVILSVRAALKHLASMWTGTSE